MLYCAVVIDAQLTEIYIASILHDGIQVVHLSP